MLVATLAMVAALLVLPAAAGSWTRGVALGAIIVWLIRADRKASEHDRAARERQADPSLPPPARR